MTWSAKLAPWLSVADAGRAVDFYQSAFGAVEPKRLEATSGFSRSRGRGIGEADFWVQFDPGGNPRRTAVAAAVATRAADSSLLARGARRSRLRCGRSSL